MTETPSKIKNIMISESKETNQNTLSQNNKPLIFILKLLKSLQTVSLIFTLDVKNFL